MDEAAFLEEHLAEPHEALYRLISFTARDLRRGLREDFREWGLTGAQFGVLLGAATGGNVGDIAAQLLSDPTSVGRIIERMEGAGLVKRYRQPPDRRVVWVRLQPKGQSLLRTLLPRHVARTRAMLGFLSEHERSELARLLTRIRAQVAAESSDGEAR